MDILIEDMVCDPISNGEDMPQSNSTSTCYIKVNQLKRLY